MAQAYFEHRRHNIHAVFHLFFRKNPFKGNWAIAAGIHDAISFISQYKIDEDSLRYLSTIKNQAGKPYFNDKFLTFLSKLEPRLTVHGVKDGEVVFPFEPIMRVEGPLFLCQLLETPILNIVNFQTLIATKAARIKIAAQKKPVIDFGFRRAQGFDGALSASKAAFIGGITATSNLWAAKNFAIPVSGTQAHSFVMSYEHQRDAFNDFAETYKDNCILVVDTFDAGAGIKDAIHVFQKLKKEGHEPLGIRLDSGDLLELSMRARASLNQAGFSNCKIIASGDLDEYEIARLEAMNAPIDAYGVGTKLVTAYDDPALGGVYKLAAVQENSTWRLTQKISGVSGKISLPGAQKIVRKFVNDKMTADHIVKPESVQDSKLNETHEKELHRLLMNDGKILKVEQNLFQIQNFVSSAIDSLPASIRGLEPGPCYPVFFDGSLVGMAKN